MPDASSYQDRPLDWRDAFDRLPLSEPDASAWPVVSNALRAYHARRVRMRWIAMAAGVAAVLAIPGLLLLGGINGGSPEPTSARVVALESESGPITVPAPIPEQRSDASESIPLISSHAIAGGSPTATHAPPSSALPSDLAPAAQRERPGKAVLAGTRGSRAPVMESRPAAAMDTAATLVSLQAESAQLEQLLMLARDEQVASGVTVALRDAQLDRITAIDAALIDDSDPAQRTALWQARVDALRDATTFESTRRWHKAQGLSMDAALVRVD